MDTFLLSLTVLLAGGLFTLLAHRQFNIMKAGYIALSITGSIIGLYAIKAPLHDGTIVIFSTTWLHLFTLSFSLDSLSAFFLIPIFAICPLAAFYSYHYMDQPTQQGRVAINYFFSTLLTISMALVATADNIISFILVWEVIKEEMKRENSSAEEARYILKKDDDKRRKWGMSLYGRDTSNSNLYDLVLRIDIMTIDDVVGILEKITNEGRFDATPESTATIKREALLANIHAKIVSLAPRARVSIKDGIVTLGNLDGILKNDADFREKTAKRLIQTYDLKDVVYAKSVKAKTDYINPFYNLD